MTVTCSSPRRRRPTVPAETAPIVAIRSRSGAAPGMSQGIPRVCSGGQSARKIVPFVEELFVFTDKGTKSSSTNFWSTGLRPELGDEYIQATTFGGSGPGAEVDRAIDSPGHHDVVVAIDGYRFCSL